MMVWRFQCPECDNLTDVLKQEGTFMCECGTLLERVGCVGCVRGVAEGQVPVSELENLADEWKFGDAQAAGSQGAYESAEIYETCSDELHELVSECEQINTGESTLTETTQGGDHE